jgi:hypothetical protein
MPNIRCTFRMLAAVDLDDQHRLERHEVEDIGTERNLTTKLEAREAPSAQQAPHALLGIGAIAPHRQRFRRSSLMCAKFRWVLAFHTSRQHPSPGRFASDLSHKGRGDVQAAAASPLS